LEWSYYE